jgi:diadenylate cyclase
MDLFARWIADIILSIGSQSQAFWAKLMLLNFSFWQIFIDILLVTVILYFIFALLKGSRAVHVLIGLSIMVVIFILSKALQLVALGWLLDRFLTVILVAIPVIFQQELRMALERLGHTKIFLTQKAREIDRMITSIVEACETLANEKKGALIVIQHSIPLKEYVDTGILLNAVVSKELLINIFNNKAPLHDGAVIIGNEKIMAASCLLPHSRENTATVMGTRHKAALGLSENTDASIVVLSEEKGTISFARNGNMEKNISPSTLRFLLSEVFEPVKRKKRTRHQIKK